MVDPNRKINRLTDRDIAFLDECEEEFKERFTDNDEEFVRHCRKEVSDPPVIDPWTARKFESPDNRRRGGGGGGGGGFRDNNRNFNNDRRGRGRGPFRHRPYHQRGRHNQPYRRDHHSRSDGGDGYGRFGQNRH